MKSSEIKIHEENKNIFLKKIEKIIKKGVKLGIKVSFEQISEVFEESIKVWSRNKWKNHFELTAMLERIMVYITEENFNKYFKTDLENFEWTK